MTAATTTPSASLTTTVDGSMIWGFANPDTAGTATAGSGYTLRLVDNDPVNFYAEDQVQAVHGAINVTWTFSNAAQFILVVGALQPVTCPHTLALTGVGC